MQRTINTYTAENQLIEDYRLQNEQSAKARDYAFFLVGEEYLCPVPTITKTATDLCHELNSSIFRRFHIVSKPFTYERDTNIVKISASKINKLFSSAPKTVTAKNIYSAMNQKPLADVIELFEKEEPTTRNAMTSSTPRARPFFNNPTVAINRTPTETRAPGLTKTPVMMPIPLKPLPTKLVEEISRPLLTETRALPNSTEILPVRPIPFVMPTPLIPLRPFVYPKEPDRTLPKLTLTVTGAPDSTIGQRTEDEDHGQRTKRSKRF